MTDKPAKHPGGRPPKDPKEKKIKCNITMTSDHHTATNGDRAGIIRRALDWYPGEVDTCVVGVVASVKHTQWPDKFVVTEIELLGGVYISVYAQPTFSCVPGDKIKFVYCDGHSNVRTL